LLLSLSQCNAHRCGGGLYGGEYFEYIEEEMSKYKKIEFHNREKEEKEIMDLLAAEPSLITFVYGPINSGKTALVNHLINQLPKEYVVFYINLRGKFISSYKDFIRALFKLERGKKEYKEILKTISEVSLKGLKFTGIPISESILDPLFREKTFEDVFEFLEDYFMKIAENKIPVLIVDELQKIGDVKIDTYLIYELFNLFIRLTKELHLCHVFGITSDSLFIERVYSEAMLQGRSRHILVDDFDEATTMNFLDKYRVSKEEKEVAWEYCGGKPVCLVELVNCENREEKVKEMFTFRTGEIETVLKRVKELGSEIRIEGSSYAVRYERLIDALKHFVERDEIDMNEVDEISKAFLVKKNVLFVDPLKKTIRPQSKLNLLAIREVVQHK